MKDCANHRRQSNYIVPGMALLLLFLFLLWNFYRYNQYLVESRQKEFLRLARSMTYGIDQLLDTEKMALDEYFAEYVENASLHDFDQDQFDEEINPAMKNYLDNLSTQRRQILYTDKAGQILLNIHNDHQDSFYQGEAYPCPEEFRDYTVFGKAFLIEEHQYVIPIIKPMLKGSSRYMIVLINMDEIYDYLDGAMEEEGDNGYVALKNQEGFILYHKDREQIGLHMVEGRKEKYPDLDMAYLEEAKRRQLTGKEASYVYHAYWLSREPIVMRKKIATFTPLFRDSEFWVLTLNMDYYAYMNPLRRFMLISLVLTTVIFLIVGWLLWQLIRNQELQKRMEQENFHLQELNAAMEEINQERMQKLHARKLGQVGMMAEKIAHDFRNFLIPVIGHAEFLLEGENLTREQREDAEKILEYAEKASDMTRHLNRIGQKEQLVVPYEIIDISQTLPQWLETIQKTGSSLVHWKIRLTDGPIRIYGNDTQLQEVVWNLCRNALDAMRESGGELCITTQVVSRSQLGQIPLLETLKRDYLILTVADTGCGMSQEVKEQIFNPFFTTKGEAGGNGLGLGVTYDIVAGHGGEIQVESEPGKGSVFRVYLPCR